MNPRLKKILIWSSYPAFYLFCLMMFAYVSAPYERIKHAIVSGFNSSDSPLKVQIEDLSWSWRFPGLSANGVRITSAAPAGAAPDQQKAAGAEYSVDDAYARVSVLKLLIGTVQLGFGIDGFGGGIDGRVATSSDEQVMELTLDELDVGKMPVVPEAVGLPLSGALNGSIDLTLPEQKLSKADGSIEIEIQKLVIGDGKAKIRDTLAMPALDAGSLKFVAQVTGGELEITEFSATGTDLELVSEGKIRLADRFDASIAEMDLRFKFSDKYKTKNDVTRGLFGEPGSRVPGVFDLDPKIAQAKRDDGFYVWHLTGPIGRLSFQPGPRGPSAAGDDRERAPRGARGRPGSRRNANRVTPGALPPPQPPGPPVQVATPAPMPPPPPPMPEPPPPPPPLAPGPVEVPNVMPPPPPPQMVQPLTPEEEADEGDDSEEEDDEEEE